MFSWGERQSTFSTAGEASFHFLTYSPDLQVAGLYNIAALSKESAMKALATMTFATALLAAQAQAQTRRITLVKGSPANYGTNGFDISWVDNSTQKYFL